MTGYVQPLHFTCADSPAPEIEIVQTGKKSTFPAGDPTEPGLTRQQRRYRERQAAKAARRKA